MAEQVTLPAALLAGLISFFSPCVLPLVPIYIGYLTGRMAGSGSHARLHTLAHALAFVMGFGAVFVALGATAGWLGGLLYSVLPTLIKVGGAILIVFGLHMMGLIAIPFLNMEKRLEMRGGRQRNYWSSLLVGVAFAAGWTPCVGPVLAGILLLAADSQTVGSGALLLAVYAVGLGVPFLVVAGLLEAAGPLVRRVSRYARIASIIGGGLLIVMGLLLLTGWFQALVFWLNSVTGVAW